MFLQKITDGIAKKLQTLSAEGSSLYLRMALQDDDSFTLYSAWNTSPFGRERTRMCLHELTLNGLLILTPAAGKRGFQNRYSFSEHPCPAGVASATEISATSKIEIQNQNSSVRITNTTSFTSLQDALSCNLQLKDVPYGCAVPTLRDDLPIPDTANLTSRPGRLHSSHEEPYKIQSDNLNLPDCAEITKFFPMFPRALCHKLLKERMELTGGEPEPDLLLAHIYYVELKPKDNEDHPGIKNVYAYVKSNFINLSFNMADSKFQNALALVYPEQEPPVKQKKPVTKKKTESYVDKGNCRSSFERQQQRDMIAQMEHIPVRINRETLQKELHNKLKQQVLAEILTPQAARIQYDAACAEWKRQEVLHD